MFSKKGFTLVELLMVVIIIGVLVTIAIPNYTRAVERSKGSKAKGTLDAIRKAELQYRALSDSYTATIDNLTEVDLPITNIAADNDWTYTIAATVSTVTITAARKAGPFSGDTITIDQEGIVSADTTGGAPW